MVKIKEIIKYQCEICNKSYFTKEECINCEGDGKESPLVKVGDMVEYEVKVSGGFSSFYVDLRVKSIKDEGHYLKYDFEEYCEDEKEWYDSDYCLIGIFGNNDFKRSCKIK